MFSPTISSFGGKVFKKRGVVRVFEIGTDVVAPLKGELLVSNLCTTSLSDHQRLRKRKVRLHLNERHLRHFCWHKCNWL
jgi:hypothetical protein